MVVRVQRRRHRAAIGSARRRTRRTRGQRSRTTPLRVDAQRNLEHVLRAAREVFGELGYGAPMEDVARRARVGVGTVYRRFPSKDVLVRRIAEEETSRLTDQARSALGQEDEPWSALSRFLRTSVASGAGRLLPPQVLRVGRRPSEADGTGVRRGAGCRSSGRSRAPGELRLVADGAPGSVGADDDTGAAALLEVVGQLVERARAAGELRPRRDGVGRTAGDRDGGALAAGRGAAGGGLGAAAGHPAGGAALAAGVSGPCPRADGRRRGVGAARPRPA